MTIPRRARPHAFVMGERDDDKQFDPWRVPASPKMANVVASVIEQIAAYETANRLRDRARRPADKASHEAMITALVCDLAYRHLVGHRLGIYLSRSNDFLSRPSRYKAPVLTKKLPHLLDLMVAMGFIEQHPGQWGARQTVIEAAPRLISMLADVDARDDIGRAGSPESIILRGPKEEGEAKGPDREYDNTPVTDRYRADMTTINDWLAAADIGFDDSILGDSEALPDVSRCRLYRVFTNDSFESGGRMEGGFWLNMKRKRRLAGIVIDGEAVAEVDFGQIGPRILYRLAGAEPPAGDLYTVPGLESWRQGVKLAINVAINAATPLVRKLPQMMDHLPRERTHGDIMKAVETVHAPIFGHFYRGIGHRIMFMESNVAVRTLLTLREAGVVALPVHDAFVVPRSKARVAADVMKAAYADIVGGDIPIEADEWSTAKEDIVSMSL